MKCCIVKLLSVMYVLATECIVKCTVSCVTGMSCSSVVMFVTQEYFGNSASVHFVFC